MFVVSLLPLPSFHALLRLFTLSFNESRFKRVKTITFHTLFLKESSSPTPFILDPYLAEKLNPSLKILPYLLLPFPLLFFSILL